MRTPAETPDATSRGDVFESNADPITVRRNIHYAGVILTALTRGLPDHGSTVALPEAIAKQLQQLRARVDDLRRSFGQARRDYPRMPELTVSVVQQDAG